jgi:hypothetical protein
VRDYVEWHREYDDPTSSLSWRLGVVRRHVTAALDGTPGRVRVLSLCAGDGRDVLGVLRDRPDAERADVTLVELHPSIAAQAREGAASVAARVEVRQADAGNSDACVEAAPADVVLLVGIFGNISERDIERTVGFAPQLCRPGATLLWSRGRDGGDMNATIRAWFAVAGFGEIAYETFAADGGPAVGVVRYDGPPVPFEPGRQLFTFTR